MNTTYESALQRAPDDINALNNQGIALQRLGNLQVANGQPDVACRAWREALQRWERALELASNNTRLRKRYEGLQRLYDEQCGQTAPDA